MHNNINRLQEEKLANRLFSTVGRDVLLVQGARQVGKTTLVQSVLERRDPNHRMFTLNLEKDIDALRGIDRCASFEDFTRFVSAHFQISQFDRPGDVLFIDEAQESEHLGRYIRFMKEEWQHIRVILSGSSMSRIFRPDTRVPVGRFQPWLVVPLVFEEFLSAGRRAHLQDLFIEFSQRPRVGLIEGALHDAFLGELDTYLTVGGLPAVVTTYLEGGDFRAHRRSIFDAQEDDFVRKSSLTERALFSRGMRGVANFLGMPSKYSHVHESKSLAEKVWSTQAAWHLILEIEQKGMSSTTQHLPKRYLYDIGIAQDLRDMPFPRLSLVSTKNPALRTQLGGIFENALLLNILCDQAQSGEVSGWRKGPANGPEVDFVWRTGDQTIALECKATQKLSLKHWSGLKAYLEATFAASSPCVGILVSAAPFEVVKYKLGTLINLPLYLATAANMRRCAEVFGLK